MKSGLMCDAPGDAVTKLSGGYTLKEFNEVKGDIEPPSYLAKYGKEYELLGFHNMTTHSLQVAIKSLPRDGVEIKNVRPSATATLRGIQYDTGSGVGFSAFQEINVGVKVNITIVGKEPTTGDMTEMSVVEKASYYLEQGYGSLVILRSAEGEVMLHDAGSDIFAATSTGEPIPSSTNPFVRVTNRDAARFRYQVEVFSSRTESEPISRKRPFQFGEATLVSFGRSIEIGTGRTFSVRTLTASGEDTSVFLGTHTLIRPGQVAVFLEAEPNNKDSRVLVKVEDISSVYGKIITERYLRDGEFRDNA